MLGTRQGIKNLFEGIGGVGVVDNNSKGLAFVDNVHATFNLGKRFDASYDLGIFETEFSAN